MMVSSVHNKSLFKHSSFTISLLLSYLSIQSSVACMLPNSIVCPHIKLKKPRGPPVKAKPTGQNPAATASVSASPLCHHTVNLTTCSQDEAHTLYPEESYRKWRVRFRWWVICRPPSLGTLKQWSGTIVGVWTQWDNVMGDRITAQAREILLTFDTVGWLRFTW